MEDDDFSKVDHVRVIQEFVKFTLVLVIAAILSYGISKPTIEEVRDHLRTPENPRANAPFIFKKH